jgi:hypothetical protein
MGQWRALMNTIKNFLVPCNVIKFFSSSASGGFSIKTQLHGVSELVMDDAE